MFTILRSRNHEQNQPLAHKREISETGALTEVLRPGIPAMYLYQGNLIRTTTRQAIL